MLGFRAGTEELSVRLLQVLVECWGRVGGEEWEVSVASSMSR